MKNLFFIITHLKTPDSRTVADYTVEGDWSGGAFLIGSRSYCRTNNSKRIGSYFSTQADKAIVDALMAANAGIAMEAKGIKVRSR